LRVLALYSKHIYKKKVLKNKEKHEEVNRVNWTVRFIMYPFWKFVRGTREDANAKRCTGKQF